MQEETKKEFGSGPAALVKYWMAEYDLACKRQSSWVKTGDKVVKKYNDDRPVEGDESSTFNVLWSNTETMMPAMYSRTPRPVVSRRFKGETDTPEKRAASELGIAASRVMQRALEVSLDSYDFDEVIKTAVQDVLLPGRGEVRVKYKPKYEKMMTPIMGEAEDDWEVIEKDGAAHRVEDRVVYEEVTAEYVYWKSFKHGSGRVWADVPWVAYDLYMDRKEGKKRFGDLFQKVTLDHSPDDSDEDDNVLKQGHVIEIWADGKTIWIAPTYKEGPLDVQDQVLNLRGGFPSPKPLLAVTTSKSLIPTPEYKLYQDQADELDKITTRIDLIVDAIKVRGLYAGDAESIPQLLQGENNTLLPVEDWMAYMDKGGVRNMIEWLPIDMLLQALGALYKARDEAKEVLYELTGISDIVRGASKATETLGAQQMKGRYAAMRFDNRKQDVDNFVKSVLQLKAEVIAEHFSAETLALMTGLEVTDEIMDLIRNDPARSFMIDIETDSTIAPDEMEEKARRTEFLSSVGGFMKEAVEVAERAPEMKPLIGQMLLFTVRGFRVGKEIEGIFEDAVDSMGGGQNGNMQQTIEQMQQQLQQVMQERDQIAQEHQAMMQSGQEAQLKAQNDANIAQGKNQTTMAIAKMEAEIKAQTELEKEKIAAQKEVTIATIGPQESETEESKDININLSTGGDKQIKIKKTDDGYDAQVSEG